MKEQNPTRKDESLKTDNEICEMCAKKEEPEKILHRKKPDAAVTARPQPVPRMSRKKLMNRLSRIEGQIRGIKGMLEKRCLLQRYPDPVRSSQRCNERV